MKTIYLLSALFFCASRFSAQVQLLNENFVSGIPASWTQTPATSWSVQPTFDASGGPCIITEEIGSNSLTTTIETKTISLAGVVNPTVSFKAAITKNNFMPGNIVLSYKQGTLTQFVARWGSGFTANTTYTIPEDNPDYQHPLDQANVTWHSYTQTISPTGNAISIVLSAELINGGYVLFDDVQVTAKTSTLSTDIRDEVKEDILIFPNPLSGHMLKINSATIITATLFDELGKGLPLKIRRISENESEIDMGGVSPGIYFVDLRVDATSCRKKVIVQ